jgi:hypothetical protein
VKTPNFAFSFVKVISALFNIKRGNLVGKLLATLYTAFILYVVPCIEKFVANTILPFHSCFPESKRNQSALPCVNPGLLSNCWLLKGITVVLSDLFYDRTNTGTALVQCRLDEIVYSF